MPILTRANRVWLVVDDVHELGPAEAGRQLELLVTRGPLELRLVLATRQDVRLGLHQLWLEASSCSAQELTAPDTEQFSQGPRVP